MVATNALIRQLWGDEPSAGARNTLQTYISQLRDLFEAEDLELLETKEPGYRIRLGEGRLDLQEFQKLLEVGRRALMDKDPRAASEHLTQALALCRGLPLEDLSSEPALRREITRLEGIRLTVLEHRIEADLLLGRHPDIVGELEELVSHYPLRERLWEQLIVALYRSGRQGEALHVVREARRQVLEEGGVEAGPALKRLESFILNQDASLDLPATPAETPRPAEQTTDLPPRASRPTIHSMAPRRLLKAERERLAERLRSFWTRWLPGETQTSVAERMNLNKAVVSKWLNAKGNGVGQREQLVGPYGLFKQVARGRIAAGRVDFVANANGILEAAGYASLTADEWEALGILGDPEFLILQVALDRALQGRGRFVAVVGAEGIGKTRTVNEFSTRARESGWRLLIGRCHAEQGAPPFRPFVQALRTYLREPDSEAVRAELESHARFLLNLLPELSERYPGLSPPPPAEPKQARFRLFDSLTSFLKTASRAQPLLLVLLDLHWADPDSLALLRFLVRELEDARILVVGTYEEDEVTRENSLSATVAELMGEGLVERLQLKGWSEEQIGWHIEATTGISPSAALVRAIYTRTEGDPLFVTEVVRLLVEEEELALDRFSERESWRVPIPESKREATRRRLDRLSQPCRDMLSTAALLGREFTDAKLAVVISELSSDQLLDLLEEALGARMIEEVVGSIGSFRFKRAHYQETLKDDPSATRGAYKHAEIGDKLERFYGESAEAHAAELAFHFAEAGGRAAKLARYALVAGEQALGSHAHEDALAHFDRALAATEGQPEDAQTAAIRFGLGRAQLALLPRHDLTRGWHELLCAFDWYEKNSDLEHAAAVAGYPLSHYLDAPLDGFSDLLKRALVLVPDGSSDAGRLLSAYGQLLAFQGDYRGGRASIIEALRIALAIQDRALEVEALLAATTVEFFHDQNQALVHGLQAVAIAGETGDEHAEMRARIWVARLFVWFGKAELARKHAEAALALAERLRERGWLSLATGPRAVLAAYEGDWGTARELSERGLTAQPLAAEHLGRLAIISYEVGEFEQGKAYVERLLEAMRSVPPGAYQQHIIAAAVIARVDGITGSSEYLNLVESAAQGFIGAPNTTPLIENAGKLILGLVAARQGDLERAVALHDEVGQLSGYAAWNIPLVRDRLSGSIALLTGRVEVAVSHFKKGLAFCRRAGYRAEEAWTAYEYSEALLQRRGPGDRSKAVTLQEAALALANKLGMGPLKERATRSG